MNDELNDIPGELRGALNESESTNIMLMLIMRRLGISTQDYLRAVQEYIVMRSNEDGK